MIRCKTPYKWCPVPCRFGMNPSRYYRAATLASSHRTGDSRADSSLRGGSPTDTTPAREALIAEAPPDTVPTVFEDRPSRSLIPGFPSIISTVVSGQIGFLSSCRSRRKKPHHKWCTVARALVLASWWSWHLGGSVRPDRTEVEGKLSSRHILDGWPRLDQEDTPSRF
jgi:hypothetical protein